MQVGPLQTAPLQRPPSSSRFQATPGLEPAHTDEFHPSAAAPPVAPRAEAAPAHSGQFWAKVGLGSLALMAGLGGTVGTALAQPPAPQVQVAKTQASPVRIQSDEYHPLAYQGVQFGKSPAVHTFGNAPVKVLNTHGQSTHGDFHLDWSTQTLTDSHGAPLWTPSGQGEVIAQFNQEASANWSHHLHIRPAGQVGPYVSMVVTQDGYTGGMSEQRDARLVTVRADTGAEVKLDELIEDTDFNDVVNKIAEVQGYSHADGYQASRAEIREAANSSFSLFQEGGKFKLAVAIPSSQQSTAGTVAQYVFQLPSEAWAR